MLVCHRRSLLSSIIGGVLDQQFMTKWPSHCLWPHQAQLYDRPHRRYSTSSRPVLLPSHAVLSCPAQRPPERNNDDDPFYSSSPSGSLLTLHTTPALLAEPNRRNRYARSYTELLPSPPPPPPPAILAAARSPLVPARWRRVRALTS